MCSSDLGVRRGHDRVEAAERIDLQAGVLADRFDDVANEINSIVIEQV